MIWSLAEIILPVFIVIGAGYIARYFELITDDAISSLTRFAQNFAIPCLLFSAIASLDLAEHFDLNLYSSFYIGAILSFSAGVLAAHYVFGRDWEDSIAIGFGALFSNSLLLGIPISERAFGPEGLSANYAIIAIHSPICYAIGITLMEIVRARRENNSGRLIPKVLSAMFHNALILGVSLGIIANVAQISIPEIVQAALDLMSSAALPVALFGLGGILYRYRPEGDLRIISVIVLLSLFLHPAIALGLGVLQNLDIASLRSATLTAAMPPGVNTFLFANMYQRGMRVAASAVLIGTALSLLIAPFWIAILS